MIDHYAGPDGGGRGGADPPAEAPMTARWIELATLWVLALLLWPVVLHWHFMPRRCRVCEDDVHAYWHQAGYRCIRHWRLPPARAKADTQLLRRELRT